ncbi:MAG: squalene synthase HpnC [Bryobacteraceae bacterium]
MASFRPLLPKDFVASREALERCWTLAESLDYTRWLATSHYENFHVVSLLLPKRLHQDFYNVYSFCRWADDLADEISDSQDSLRLLSWWRGMLDQLYEGQSSHPVFIALSGTIQKHGIPKQPFSDLLLAFVQDQTTIRYATWEELFDYCRYSANPVGRLVLYLCGYRDGERQRLSDATCTALQLANFWQDVSVDLQKNRVYIPLEVMARHGYTEAELFAGEENAAFEEVMRDVVSRAHQLFQQGLPLNRSVGSRLAVDLELFSRGGIRVLEKIEQQGYRVLHRRPVIGKLERLGLLLGSLARVALRPFA